MATWNSISLENTYSLLGWIHFLCWSFSFYPQYLLNYKRKSVVGLNFDFLLLNLIKQSLYLIYNASMFFSPLIQHQYRQKYGYNVAIPVGANDFAFSVHAVASKAFVGFQILIYERGNQKVSKTCIFFTSVLCLTSIVCVILAWPNHSWLWLISVFNSMQVLMTVIKNLPQAIMNFKRKSIEGFSIGIVVLELIGGVAGLAQMGVQSIDNDSFVNFYGNIGKTLLILEIAFFDFVYIFQRYVLYPPHKVKNRFVTVAENASPLLKLFHNSSESEQI